MKLTDYILQLSMAGKHYFRLEDALSALQIKRTALWASLGRLQDKGEITSPFRGFYLIIPPEYRSLGCLPPEQFVPNLMKFLNLPYYVCLLSAAQFYGVAHQQPQIFQVMVEKNRPSISCGRVNIHFIAKAKMSELPTKSFNTPKGSIRIATPEVTALDLMIYPHQAGGLNNVATTFFELSEKIDWQQLFSLITTGETLCAIQRMGYVLEQIEMHKFAEMLWEKFHIHFKRYTPLSPKASIMRENKNKRWKIYINMQVESDL